MSYYNYRTYYAASSWDRRSFLNAWWRINQRDPNWVPPYYPTLRRELNPAHNPHLARLNPVFVHLEALPRRERSSKGQSEYNFARSAAVPGLVMETPVASGLLLSDPRQPIPTIYIALLHTVNDPGPLGRLLDEVTDIARQRGCRKVIAPTGISSHLNSGLLQDHWNKIPPLNTPYAPPYSADIFGKYMHPLSHRRLYQLSIPAKVEPPSNRIAELIPLQPERLKSDLLPLFAATCPRNSFSQPPDEQEAAFLTRWIKDWFPVGWLAQINDTPVGFVLMQPDLAPILKRYQGGHNLIQRGLLQLESKRPLSSGRVLFGGVLPEWRRRGIGTQLLTRMMRSAKELKWQSLSIGPVPESSDAAAFLSHHHAIPLQTYCLYEREL